MQWSDIPRNPSSRTLRQFGGLCLVIFGGLGLWDILYRERPVSAAIFGVLALGIGPLGLLKPQAIRWIYVGWMILVFPIGWTVSRVVLAVLFFVVITPVALIFRLVGRDPLWRRYQPELATYWKPKTLSADPRSYLRQF
jgi:hypothetical protein